ncbi:hypothetical protein [Streptomyces longwoodensis]|uniref:hypothetical protein n=1 Tax=Streptomyces longwoodensis TaxID=68231 RepID=UPI0036F034E4
MDGHHHLPQQARDVVCGQAGRPLPLQDLGQLGQRPLLGVRAPALVLVGPVAGVPEVDGVLQQLLGDQDPVPVPQGQREGARPGGHEPARHVRMLGRLPGPGRGQNMREQPAHPGRGEGAGLRQAQQRAQHVHPGRGERGGVAGQPRPCGLGGGGGQVLKERGRRPDAGGLVCQQQVRRVLLKGCQPGRGRGGAEEERGGARVRPAGQLPRLLLTRLLEGGQLEDPGGAAGQRHQQLPRQQQHLPVNTGRAGQVGFTAVQRARGPPVHLAPPGKGLLVVAAQRHAHQPVGDPRRPRPVEAARARQLPAQHLGGSPQAAQAGGGVRGPLGRR